MAAAAVEDCYGPPRHMRKQAPYIRTHAYAHTHANTPARTHTHAHAYMYTVHYATQMHH